MAFTPKNWEDSPATTTPISAAALEDLEVRVTDYTDTHSPSIVTSLPGSPTNGDEVYYKVGTGDNALLWHLRYDSSITDAYKWRFLGGPPLEAESLASVSFGSVTLNTWSSSGTPVAVTIPLAGKYDVDTSASLFTGGTTALLVAVQINASDTNDTDAALAHPTSTTWTNNKWSARVTSASAAVTITQRVRPGATTTIDRRAAVLFVRPVRVG